MKYFEFFINLVFWFWAFIVPAGTLAFLGFYLYIKSDQNLPFAILLTAAGIFTGILVAERIRKKYGLSHFFSRIMATPELDDYQSESTEAEASLKNKENPSEGKNENHN